MGHNRAGENRKKRLSRRRKVEATQDEFVTSIYYVAHPDAQGSRLSLWKRFYSRRTVPKHLRKTKYARKSLGQIIVLEQKPTRSQWQCIYRAVRP